MTTCAPGLTKRELLPFRPRPLLRQPGLHSSETAHDADKMDWKYETLPNTILSSFEFTTEKVFGRLQFIQESSWDASLVRTTWLPAFDRKEVP
jgi:hypothetical protein